MLGWGRDKKDEARAEKPATGSGVHSPAATHPSAHPAPSASSSDIGLAPRTVESLEALLVEAGAITQSQLDEALAEQAKTGVFLGQILVDKHFIDDNSFTSLLAKQCRIPHLSLLDYLIDKELLKVVSKEMCIKYCLLPIDRMGKNLTVAMVNPLDAAALTAVRAACPDLRIKPILCAYQHFEAVSRKLFDTPRPEASDELSMTSLGFVREPAQPPKPPVPKTAAAAEVGSSLDSDSLVDTIFGQRACDLQPKPEETKEPSGQALFDSVAAPLPSLAKPKPAASDSSAVMREMISVMQDSMCDTYGILARRMDLFNGLTPGDVAKIFAKGVTTEFHPGDVIFSKGQVGREMYVILGGKVEVRDGERELAELGKGDMFGEMALMSKAPRSATVIALEASSMLILSKETIHQLLSKDAAIQILENIVITLCERLRTANER